MIMEKVSQLFNSLEKEERAVISVFSKQEQIKQIEREKNRLQRNFRAQIKEMDKVIISIKHELIKDYEKYVTEE